MVFVSQIKALLSCLLLPRYFHRLLLVATITLHVGCGSENASTYAGDAVDQSESNSLKIMFIGQITDTANNTSLPEAAEGAKAAVTRINLLGGINGRHVELLICDDKADANEAAKCARKAIRDNVICTVGNTSNHGNVILSTLQQAGIASLGHNPISALDFSSPMAFPLQGGSPTAIAGAARLLAEQGHRRIKLAAVDSLAGAISEGFVENGLAQSASALVDVTLIPIGAPDYASYAASLITDADGIVVATNADQAARIIMALRQANAAQAIAAPAVAFPQSTIDQLKDNANGVYLSLSFKQDSSDDYALYLDDMQNHAQQAKINYFSLQSWLAVTVLERLLTDIAKNDTPLTAAEVLDKLSTLDNATVSDLIPAMTTQIERAAPFNRLFIDKVLYGKIENNRVTQLDGVWH